ncbi:asparagine synthase (glutamine-hydrolyzing) [Candidatus Woesearchaeota archaeon]|nr:asparagine synthase (glutamine-hydrolyzing) [Candidatus Woesearchaeota archaeon]
MCGITGFTWEDRELLRRMTDIVSYRGPDDHGYHTDKGISLGHRRLSIIDLSSAGHQPMSDSQGEVTIVYNGEIYNFKELRAELEKSVNKPDFASDTDTEVLIYGYREWGPEGLLERLNGMFAFAIWDAAKKQLFLARDRLGIKPLYYAETGIGLIFASELKSILECPEIRREIDLDALNSYLTYRFITSDSTVLKGIRKLLPGHYAIYRYAKLSIRKYWDIESKFSVIDRPEQFFMKRFRALLDDCVEKRLMSDVPLGAYLSGGLDSSLIVAVNAALRDDPVKTFTVGFGHATDEFRHAKVVAEHLGTEHHELMLDYREMTRSLPKIVWYMDEPNSDITMVPLYFLSEFARKKVTVVNTGEGADELFSGYPHFRVGSPSFRTIPGFIKKNVYNLYYSPFKSWERRTLFWSDVKEDGSLKQYLDKAPPRDLLNRILLFDMKNELPNWQLQRVDRMTMAHSQEARVPFLDHRMVEFAARVPVKLKLKTLDGKYLIKKAVKDVLPEEIITRRKQGFTTPRDEWIKEDLQELAFSLLSKRSVQKRRIFDYKYIERLKRKVSASGDKPFRPYSYKLMMLAMFEMWCQMYLDRASPGKILSV